MTHSCGHRDVFSIAISTVSEANRQKASSTWHFFRNLHNEVIWLLAQTEAVRLCTSQAELPVRFSRMERERQEHLLCRANVLQNLSLPWRIQITLKLWLSFSTRLPRWKNAYVMFSCNAGASVAALVEFDMLRNLTVYAVAGSLGGQRNTHGGVGNEVKESSDNSGMSSLA
ncbi:hypothetical protein YC2023_110368 [Brassica napus]